MPALCKKARVASLPGRDATSLGRNREFDEAVLMGSNEEFLAGRNTEFIEDAGQVMAYRNHGNAEAVGNILVGKALSHQRENLTLSFRQRTSPLGAI